MEKIEQIKNLSESDKAMYLSLAVRDHDIIRFALNRPKMSQDDIIFLTGIDRFPIALNKNKKTKIDEAFSEAKGWFSVRSNPKFFQSKENLMTCTGNVAFWHGVCNGYRSGVNLCKPKYFYHANEMVNNYAHRISSQIEGMIDKSFFEYTIGDCDGGLEAIRKSILLSSLIYSGEDSLRSFFDDIEIACDTEVGLGDYIVRFQTEDGNHGYWNNKRGWIKNKAAATPFDSPNDIFALPSHNYDVNCSQVISFHDEPDPLSPKAKSKPC